jgi:hypothetical protein
MAKTEQLVQACLWQRMKGAGLERFELLKARGGWLLRGTLLAMEQKSPAEARYEIACDAQWRTQRAKVWLRANQGERSVNLSSRNGRWRVNGKPAEGLAGCLDIDLGWSPSTNTLPIRRLGLAMGEASGPVTAAWVSFPDLHVQPLPQEYRRISARVYRYTSQGGEFQADLLLDDHRVVVDYEGLWQRVKETK